MDSMLTLYYICYYSQNYFQMKRDSENIMSLSDAVHSKFNPGIVFQTVVILNSIRFNTCKLKKLKTRQVSHQNMFLDI